MLHDWLEWLEFAGLPKLPFGLYNKLISSTDISPQR
jgi:hypothetical protein